MVSNAVERRCLKRRSLDMYIRWADKFIANHNEIKWPVYAIVAIVLISWAHNVLFN